jgi:type II secretory pathway pseudopilin PulG
MSGTTVFGIVVIAFSVVGIAIVAAMFVWGAREDGRDQKRTDARLSSGRRDG